MKAYPEPSSEAQDGAPARRVDRLGGLGIHVFAFLAVNAVLATQYGFHPEAGHFWGWGVGLAAHAFAMLGHGGRLGLRPRKAAARVHEPAGSGRSRQRANGDDEA